MNASCWTEPDSWLYGGPVGGGLASASSSLSAVVTKSVGIDRDQLAIVEGGRSGEEKRIVRITAISITTPVATETSLTMSYGDTGRRSVVASLVEFGVAEPPAAELSLRRGVGDAVGQRDRRHDPVPRTTGCAATRSHHENRKSRMW